jgi:hypothetical protein
MSDAQNQTPPGQTPPVQTSPSGAGRFTRAVTRSPLTLADLTQDLLWPRLFRSAGLALAPSRLIFAMVLIISLGLIDRLLALVSRRDSGPLTGLFDSVALASADLVRSLRPWSPDPLSAGEAINRLFVVGPSVVFRDAWWTLLPALPVALVLIAVLGSAIARGALCEFALNAKPTWTQTLGFAVRRWFSAWGALTLPLLGLVLLALLFGVVLVLGVVAAVAMFAYAAGSPMLTGAIAAENADAFDAIQRVYAYVIARPVRTVAYSLLNVGQFIVAITIIASIAYAALWFVQSTTRVPLEQLPRPFATFVTVGDRSGSAPAGTIPPGDRSAFDEQLARASRGGGVIGDFGSRADRDAMYADKNRTFAWSQRIVDFWTGVLMLVVGAFGVSFFFCSGAIQYLLLRQLVDGQDANEIWIEGSTDAALRPLVNPAAVAQANAQATSQAGTPPGTTPTDQAGPGA